MSQDVGEVSQDVAALSQDLLAVVDGRCQRAYSSIGSSISRREKRVDSTGTGGSRGSG